MAPANPWLALLGEDDQKSSQPNASFDPSIQAMMNAQAAGPDAQQVQPSALQGFAAEPNPAPMPSRGMDQTDWSKMLAPFDVKKTAGYPIEQQAIDRLKAYRDKLGAQPNKLDLTPLMALADAWNKGSNLTASYKAPMTADEKAAKQAAVDEAIAKEGGSLTEQDLKALNDQRALEIAKIKLGQQGEGKASDQEEKDANTLFGAYQKEVNNGRFAPTVQAQSNINKVDRLKGLLGKFKDKYGNSNYDAVPLEGLNSLSELAIGANNLLAAGGQGSEGSRQSLIPPTLQGKYSSVEQFLSGKPTGAEMGQFVKNVEATLDTERAINASQVKGGLDQINAAYGTGRLSKTNPKRYQAITNAFLNAPSLQPTQGQPPTSDFKVGEIRINKNDGLPYRKEADGSYTKVVGGQ